MFTFDDGIGTVDRPGVDSAVRDVTCRSDDVEKVEAVGAHWWTVEEELDGGGLC